MKRNALPTLTLILPDLRGGACVGASPELFHYAQKPTEKQTEAAKAICATCPITTQADCLEWAVDNGEHGIWAGTIDAERDELVNRRRRSAA